jgi:hypothetical protein
MNYEDILGRINELENIKNSMNNLVSTKRIELATKKAEVLAMEEEIARNIFENTEEHKELEELKITRKWLER